MAIYTTRSTRNRRLTILVAIGFVVGMMLGALGGRLTAPTPEDRVAEVRAQARAISAQLRVLSLHSEAGAASLGSDGNAGADLGLHRADGQLRTVFDQAPWINLVERSELQQRLTELERTAPTNAARPEFATAIDRLASDIDRTFGISG